MLGEQQEDALAFDFDLGGVVTPPIALMYDVSMWLDSENGARFALAVNSFAAQYWPSPRVWLKAGLGVSQARISSSLGARWK